MWLHSKAKLDWREGGVKKEKNQFTLDIYFKTCIFFTLILMFTVTLRYIEC